MNRKSLETLAKLGLVVKELCETCGDPVYYPSATLDEVEKFMEEGAEPFVAYCTAIEQRPPALQVIY